MDFSSTLYHMATNPNHPDFSQLAYNSEQPVYVWKDNTVYYRSSAWTRDFRNWLEVQGIDLDPMERTFYHPIAIVKDNILTGYNTKEPNVANKFLEMNKSTRESYFPNLYFVQVGNHPYPKEARFHHTWIVENYHRECHQIFNPSTDPKDFFLLPKDILP